ncbi:methyltransferase domain-containing protein [Paenibacillus sanfengchensis]|uniref:methyltransferase domain-containing protein n=1 Tax=Paenibacillus sanfengchensis TaxID=3119819 RepID=UPI002FE0E69D
MIRRYGKSFTDIADIKGHFFSENENLVRNNYKMAEIYKSQPRRERCKNCDNILNDNVYFTKQKIDYYLCSNCNHLNGAYEDTEDFASAIYVEEVTNYSVTYTNESLQKYIERMDRVYKPKAEFLIHCLDNLGIEYRNKSFCDLGAGSGYFIYALNKLFGINKIKGYEVSTKQVELGNIMLQSEFIYNINISGLQSVIDNSTSNIFSMIGVLEHLTNPRDILSSLRVNPNVEFLYLSLPLFSYSVFFELVNQDVFNRHLSGGHTHLYTMESIEYLCNEFNFDIVGQWQFGTDFMDLYRHMVVRMHELNVSSEAINLFGSKFTEVLDDLQKTADKQHFSSEIHLLLQKRL